MIIFEGPDGAGKTTLINQISSKLGIPIAPRVVSKEAKAMFNLMEWVDNNLDEGFQRMIFDRHRLISETIYGPILRPEAEGGFDRMAWLAPRMKRLYELEPIIIYCLPTRAAVRGNVMHDDDNEVVRSRINSLYSAYVARASLDYTFAPGIVKVWDYKNSPTIDGFPTWLPEIEAVINQRTNA